MKYSKDLKPWLLLLRLSQIKSICKTAIFLRNFDLIQRTLKLVLANYLAIRYIDFKTKLLVR